MAKPKRRVEEPQNEISSSHAQIVTPVDDVTDLPFMARFIDIGAAGTLSVVDESGAVVNFPSMPAGHTFFIRASRIRLTGTTVAAGNIVVYY